MSPGDEPGADSSADSSAGLQADAFRAALACWASGVAVVAVREEGRVLATTVSSMMSISLRPPLIALALGPGAQVLPFLSEGRSFGVSVLAEGQQRLAAVFADAYPVGPSPFPAEGDPFVQDVLVALGCRVRRSERAGDHVLVLALVEHARLAGERPLVRYDRGYRGLAL